MVEINADDGEFKMKDTKGFTIWVKVSEFTNFNDLEIGSILIVSQGKIIYKCDDSFNECDS